MPVDREVLRRGLRGLGFDVVRFARVGETTPGGEAFKDWLAKGFAGDMAWLERSQVKRLNAREIVPEATSMILLGVNYGEDSGKVANPEEKPVWARYAHYRDYHDTIKPGLVAAGRLLEESVGLESTDYRYYVDTGPVLERSWAAQAGVGFTGKNAMLISKDFGNWLFLAAIVVRADIPPDSPVSRRAVSHPVGTLCGSCRRCLDACPTHAFAAPGVLDARRCISYQTIENKGIIPVALRRGIGNRIYGCDICAEVCPWNRFAQNARSVLLTSNTGFTRLSLREILELTPERFAEVFRGTAMKRLKLRGLLRNACIVAANTKAVDCADAVVKLASHPEPVVRAHAVWAAGQLGRLEELEQARQAEHDLTVIEEYVALKAT